MSCSVEGCDGKHEARGLCMKHYARLKSTGSPVGMKIIRASTLSECLLLGSVNRDNGCTEWNGTIATSGYGVVHFKGRHYLAHRASYMVNAGEIPDGYNINHRCDNRRCVKAEHLYAGTQKQNIEDMLNRGRADRRGMKSHSRKKLTESDVLAIRVSQKTNSELATDYGVTRDCIYSVVTRRTWRI